MARRRLFVGMAIAACAGSMQLADAQPWHTPAPVDDLCPAVAQPVPRVRYVDDSAPTNGTGTTWTSPYNNLQSALNEAAINPTNRYDIRVGQGTYKPTTTLDRSIAFELQNNATVRGGYAGIGAANPNLRNIDLYVSTLSGNIGILSTALDNSYNVVRAGTGVTSAALLEGFTIRDGRADGSIDAGGGLALNDASPRTALCTFTSNYANRGGAINIANFSFDLRAGFLRCRFFSNSALYRGGAINLDAGMARIYNGTFSNNAGVDAASQGGAIYAGGYSVGCGGNPGVAGGVSNGDPAPRGDIVGGGLSDTGDLLLVNCLFTLNSANDGGAIYLAQQAIIDHATFSANSAVNNGGGLNSEWGYWSSISNCILWLNTDTNGTAIDQEAQIYDPFLVLFDRVNYSCVQGLNGSLGGTGNIGTDPLFRSPGSGNYRLQYNSTSVNSGNAAYIPPDRLDMDADAVRFETTPQDLDDVTRIFCVVDRGAYEFHDCNGNHVDDIDDIAIGTTPDSNADNIPDGCQDCNNNGTPDPLEIRAGTLTDCNRNGVPDLCELPSQGDCNQNQVPDTCEGCAVDLVYVVDTSGSMCGELDQFCAMVEQVRAGLTAQGLDVRVTVFGIYSCGSCSIATCISRYVDTELTPMVPCNPGPCGPQIFEDESWAPASAIVAQHFPWRAGAKRYVIPVSDEGPCQGDPCDDTIGSDDDLSVQNAIVVCNQNNVDALPITGSFSSNCVRTLADRLATGTGGLAFHHSIYSSYPNIGSGLTSYIRTQAPSFCGTCPRLISACAVPIPESEGPVEPE